MFVENKAEIDSKDKNCWTPLHAAASGVTESHVHIVAFLLDRGADPRLRTNDDSLPLHYFVRMDPVSSSFSHDFLSSFLRTIERLCNHNGEKIDSKMKTAVNSQNKHGESPLHYAAIKGGEQSIIALERIGADLNLVNKFGETSLVVAIRAERPSVVKLLIELGADVTIRSGAGTPMELAKGVSGQNGIKILEILNNNEEGTHEGGKDGGGLIEQSFKCPSCGEIHTEIPLHFHAPYPSGWILANEEEKSKGKCTLDICIIEKQYYVKGLLEIPVTITSPTTTNSLNSSNHNEDHQNVCLLTWGVWANVTEEVFKRIEKIWLKVGREKSEKLHAGILGNSLPGYEVDTVGIKIKLQVRAIGKRPAVLVENCDHVLYLDQKNGISLDALGSLVTLLMQNKTVQL